MDTLYITKADLNIEHGRGGCVAQPRPPQPAGAQWKRPRYADEWHSRRSLLKMFLLGASFRHIGRLHPENEDGFARDVRGAIMAAEPVAQAQRRAA